MVLDVLIEVAELECVCLLDISLHLDELLWREVDEHCKESSRASLEAVVGKTLLDGVLLVAKVHNFVAEGFSPKLAISFV